MNAIDLVRRLHEHRVWSNRRLLDAVKGLSDEELRRAFPIGQGSVWGTLCHLLGAEYVWLGALEGNETPLFPGDDPDRLPGNQRGDGAMTSLAELRARWDDVDARWAAWLSSLDDASLDTVVYKVSTSSGRATRFGTRRADVLAHLCTHAQYTTAQLINMLRQLGFEGLPDVMLITMARQEAADPIAESCPPS